MKINQVQKLREQVARYKNNAAENRRKKRIIIDADRRLQEMTQKLLMSKQNLERKNRELKIAREKDKHRNEELERELNVLKQLAGSKIKKKAEPSFEKKLTRTIAEDLSLRYIHLLESYVKSKDLDKDESLVGELCLKLIECGVTPKGIISMHLKAVPQIKTIGDLETKRVTFESRMVLLKVMTQYATLLLIKKET